MKSLIESGKRIRKYLVAVLFIIAAYFVVIKFNEIKSNRKEVMK